MALVVVILELRAARRARHGPSAGSRRQPDGSPEPAWRPLTLADLEAAAARDQPGVLLRLLLEALKRRGLIRLDPAATHREIGLAGTELPAADARVLDRVACVAERSRFAEAGGGADDGGAVAAGITLLGRLARPGTEADPACASV
jgi:hypothetical protein